MARNTTSTRGSKATKATRANHAKGCCNSNAESGAEYGRCGKGKRKTASTK